MGIGTILMVQSIRATAAAGADLVSVASSEAGFATDLEALLDKAITEQRVWNLHGVVVVRKGRSVYARYFEGGDNARGRPLGKVALTADTLHDLRSVSKSIVGLLYGIALGDGKVPPPDAPLFASFPEYADLAADPARNRWTIHHVLTMTLGTDWDELSVPYSDPTNSAIAMDIAPDRYRFVLGGPVVMVPGERWSYNGGATSLLARIIAKEQTIARFRARCVIRPSRHQPDGMAYRSRRRSPSRVRLAHDATRSGPHRPDDAEGRYVGGSTCRGGAMD
jgi:CubicO group peptidase (beta-lactamase class C family)